MVPIPWVLASRGPPEPSITVYNVPCQLFHPIPNRPRYSAKSALVVRAAKGWTKQFPRHCHRICTVPFDYSEKNLARLERAISAERLKPYLVKARGDIWIAVQLYIRNQELSEALYGVVQGYEVFLRNATNGALAKGFGKNSWWENASLRDRERDDINNAKQSIADRNVLETSGRIVAELNLGFWTNLYSNYYEHTLWVPHLRGLFPMSIARKKLHDRLDSLKVLRNRIAHHETLNRRDVKQDYEHLLETIGWMSPTVRDWVTANSCFEDRYAKRIPKRPSIEVSK